MEFEQYRQSVVDEEDLRLLPVVYWVSGGFTAFFSLYFLIYLFLGLGFVLTPAGAWGPGENAAPPPFFGWLFVAIGGVGVLVLGTIAVLKVVAGFSISRHRRRTFCMVVAGLSCIELPYGTMFGVFTFIVLGRPSVKALFGQSPVELSQRASEAPPAT